ncbi:hypothetical protein [Actinomycetospora straminea]|nr:hypothetical protein [Actinomycetospora straminea]MDD7935696.1 hypothetical protein [Actinomycetospora straminea]
MSTPSSATGPDAVTITPWAASTGRTSMVARDELGGGLAGWCW